MGRVREQVVQRRRHVAARGIPRRSQDGKGLLLEALRVLFAGGQIR